MASKPTKLPTWATTAAVDDITEPPDANKTTGWLANFPPPHEWFNYWQNLVYQWIAWLDGGGVGYYTDPTDAYDDMADGEVAMVFEAETGAPGDEHTLAASPVSTIQDMDVDGAYVLYALTTAGYRRPRDLTATVTTYTPTNAGTVVAIATDGDSVALAYGNYVECYDMDGTSRWVYDHLAAVRDVAFVEGDVVYVGTGAAGNTYVNVRRLSKAAGVSMWSRQHNGLAASTLHSVCAAGGRVFAAGAANSSGANLRAYLYDGSLPVLGGGGVTSGADVSEPGCLASDGVVLYVGLSANPYLETYSVMRLEALDTLSAISGENAHDCHAVAVDQDHVYLALEDGTSGDGYVRAVTKDTLAPIYQTETLSSDYPTSVASDGSALFYGQTADSGGVVHRVYRGRNRVEPWRRTDHSGSDVTPWARAIHPIRER